MSKVDERHLVHDRLSLLRRPPSGSQDTGPDTADSAGADAANGHGASVAPIPGWLAEPESRTRAGLIPARLRGARLALTWRGGLGLGLGGLLAAMATAIFVWLDQPSVPPAPPIAVGRAAATSTAAVSPAAELVVSVAGLVHRPGLVRVPAGARVADALAAAGGIAAGADALGVNLAARVADGEQIVVGARGQALPGSTPRAAAGAGAKVALNAATAEQLHALPGIGPVTAAAIVAWRNAHGSFTSVDQLGEVDGIGPARLARLRTLVTV